MLSGKRFKLNRDTVSLEEIEGRRRAIVIDAGAILEVLSGPTDGDGLVNVCWEGRKLAMFEADLKERGTEVGGRSAKA